MVNPALSIGAGVGILLSAGFVYWQVGRYAAPQVPESRFDERKEMIAYTAGLFVGIPLTIPLLFLVQAIPLLEIGGIALYLALLVGGTEIAQWFQQRTAYFGQDGSGPFYVLGFRAGIGGILILALVTQYFAASGATVLGVAAVLAEGLAIVALQAAAGMLAVPGRKSEGRVAGGPASALPLELVGFFFVGVAAAADSATGLAVALVIAAGAWVLYRSVARVELPKLPLRPRTVGPEGEEPPRPSFGRLDR
ncbi:MAG: hypothetical protein L3J93_01290 [Thermoplasmata archaeon]|nr:hypothetical protein [Thermoplasmata archaeon]